MSNCTSCLHPQFTDSIAKLLQTHSVNVIIPTMGAEAERFVQDIQQYPWEQQVLVVNMADCRQDYALFSQQLSQAYQAVSENQADLESIYRQLREETRSFPFPKK